MLLKIPIAFFWLEFQRNAPVTDLPLAVLLQLRNAPSSLATSMRFASPHAIASETKASPLRSTYKKNIVFIRFNEVKFKFIYFHGRKANPL